MKCKNRWLFLCLFMRAVARDKVSDKFYKVCLKIDKYLRIYCYKARKKSLSVNGE